MSVAMEDFWPLSRWYHYGMLVTRIHPVRPAALWPAKEMITMRRRTSLLVLLLLVVA